MKTTLNINGITKYFEHPGGEKLLDTLRNNGYTEVKRGCAEGECGACLVLLNGKPVNTCRVFTAAIPENHITTVKGLGSIRQPHLIQEAFAESGAVQCGFCTPALVLATYALLQNNPEPATEDIHKAMDGILCRCTGYVKIIDAVKLAATKLKPETA